MQLSEGLNRTRTLIAPRAVLTRPARGQYEPPPRRVYPIESTRSVEVYVEEQNRQCFKSSEGVSSLINERLCFSIGCTSSRPSFLLLPSFPYLSLRASQCRNCVKDCSVGFWQICLPPYPSLPFSSHPTAFSSLQSLLLPSHYPRPIRSPPYFQHRRPGLAVVVAGVDTVSVSESPAFAQIDR